MKSRRRIDDPPQWIGEPIPILGFPLFEMTVDDFRRSLDSRSSANRGMQRSSDKNEGAASNGSSPKQLQL
jgi:hypothetical protein